MTKLFTARNVLAITALLVTVVLLSFPGKGAQNGESQGTECSMAEPEEENELFWESLSRQFSGSAVNY